MSRSAMVPGMQKRHGRCGYENKQGNRYSLPELMEMDVNTALQATADLKVVHQRLEVLKNLGLGLSDAGRGNAKPFRRRGTAAETCQRNGKRTVGFGVCV